jgi:hypothetical protein
MHNIEFVYSSQLLKQSLTAHQLPILSSRQQLYQSEFWQKYSTTTAVFQVLSDLLAVNGTEHAAQVLFLTCWLALIRSIMTLLTAPPTDLINIHVFTETAVCDRHPP